MEPQQPKERSKPKTLMGNALWSLVSTGWFTVVGFVLTPVLLARLGAGQYGLWVLLASITGVLGIMDLGLGEATLRYMAHYHGQGDVAGMNRMMGATVSVYLTSGVATGVGLLLGAPWVAGWLCRPMSWVWQPVFCA